MEKAQADISAYGLDQFKALEPDIPKTRIYDKLTFLECQDCYWPVLFAFGWWTSYY